MFREICEVTMNVANTFGKVNFVLTAMKDRYVVSAFNQAMHNAWAHEVRSAEHKDPHLFRLTLPLFESIHDAQDFAALLLEYCKHKNDGCAGNNAGDVPQPRPTEIYRCVVDHRYDREE